MGFYPYPRSVFCLNPDFVQKRKIIKQSCVMQCFFPRLYFFRIKVLETAVTKTPAVFNIRVFFVKSLKILARNPPCLVPEPSVNSLHKDCYSVKIKVICKIALKMSFHQCNLRYCTSSGKQVIKIGLFWKMFINPFGDIVFRSFIGDSVQP